jgi:Nitrile hydratase beta subunit
MNPISYFPYRHYERSLDAITAYFQCQGYVCEDELERKTADLSTDPSFRCPLAETRASTSR